MLLSRGANSALDCRNAKNTWLHCLKLRMVRACGSLGTRGRVAQSAELALQARLQQREDVEPPLNEPRLTP